MCFYICFCVICCIFVKLCHNRKPAGFSVFLIIFFQFLCFWLHNCEIMLFLQICCLFIVSYCFKSAFLLFAASLLNLLFLQILLPFWCLSVLGHKPDAILVFWMFLGKFCVVFANLVPFQCDGFFKTAFVLFDAFLRNYVIFANLLPCRCFSGFYPALVLFVALL